MVSKKPPDLGAQFTTAIFDRIRVDRYTITGSALGDVCVGWTARGVSAVRLARTVAAQDDFVRWYAERIGRAVVRAVELDEIARAAQTKLSDDRGEVPLDLETATPLERTVLASVAQISRGHARPHDLLAADAGTPAPVAAVTEILARNPIPLLVPCHRAVSAEFRGGSYVFGADAQQQLLKAEGLDVAAIDRVIARGYRYIGCDDGSFCLPTCGDIAARLDRPGYRGLHSISEAHEHGLRACESCRPVAAA